MPVVRLDGGRLLFIVFSCDCVTKASQRVAGLAVAETKEADSQK